MIVLYGTKPKSKAGLRFSRMSETWSPLWEYCWKRHGNIMQNVHIDDEDGGTYVMSRRDADQLALQISADHIKGGVEDYVRSRDLLVTAFPPDVCSACGGTGIRTDEVGDDLMLETMELPLEQVLRFGRTHGWCNECNGEGMTMVWERSCSLTVDDIMRFARFLRSSGGCRIY